MRLFSNSELIGVLVGSTVVICLLSFGTESVPKLIFNILMGVVLAHVLKAGHNMIKRNPESKADYTDDH